MLENSVVQGFFRARAAGVNLDLADGSYSEIPGGIRFG